MRMPVQAADIIRTLALTPHPEGGHYREIVRCEEKILGPALPERCGRERSLYTSIYYLLQAGEVSRIHRLRSDELWCLLSGGPLVIHGLHPDGRHTAVKLGSALAQEERLVTVVPQGVWFGAMVLDPGAFALVDCTVIPGFEFGDFELGDRAQLLAAFPAQRAIIELLT
jgi:predicted cupin superfamily sugar epimerase